MNSRTDSYSWISAYVYFDGSIYSDECDFVITSLLSPFINKYQSEKYFDSYFFIRYSDSGPHIRIRFSGNKAVLEKNLKPVFEEYIIKSFPLLAAEIGKIKDTPTDGSKYIIKWVEYEPEIERYGGEFAIKVAEEYFYYSSKTAIDLLLTQSHNNGSSRLGKGLALMVVLLHQFLDNKENAVQFVKIFSDGYLQSIAKDNNYKNLWIKAFDEGFKIQAPDLINIVNLLWEGADKEGELPDELIGYNNSLRIIKNKLSDLLAQNKIIINKNNFKYCNNSLLQIIPSYIHMMNNRMGVPIKDESYIAHLIAQGLEKTIVNSYKEGE